MCRAAGNEGGGAAWSDSGSEGAPGGQDRFLESLMSLRRSAKSFGLDTAGTDFPAETPQHVRLPPCPWARHASFNRAAPIPACTGYRSRTVYVIPRVFVCDDDAHACRPCMRWMWLTACLRCRCKAAQLCA